MPVTHPLAQKERLSIRDLYGQRLMLIQRGWNGEVDALRDRLHREHGQIEIVNFDFFSARIFENCERSGSLMMTIPYWGQVHPLLRIIPVDWDCQVSFGLFHAPHPSLAVQHFLDTVRCNLGL